MDNLSSKETLIVFLTSPTGLGHIRVLDAIKDGLPDSITSETIGLEDVSAQKIHNKISRNSLLNFLMEFVQSNKTTEALAAKLYIRIQNKVINELLDEIKKLIQIHPQKNYFLFVATHCNLAYPVSFFKKEIERIFGIKIAIFVVVTDDSPQRVWSVPGVDRIFVPSPNTADTLSKFHDNRDVFKVIPFPVSPRLKQKLNSMEIGFLYDQFNPEKSKPMHFVVPVSGAAVQLDYISRLINSLTAKGNVFTVVGQESRYSQNFFKEMRHLPKVQILIGMNAKQTVNYYESLYFQSHRPGIEITKPSEQSFKSLFTPRQRGGVLILLTKPIGRQEKDNLHFLERHHLMPNEKEQEYLENKVTKDTQNLHQWHYKASHWRALKLPENPIKAFSFIDNMKQTGIFYAMLSFEREGKHYFNSDGVEKIWEEVEQFLTTSNNR